MFAPSSIILKNSACSNLLSVNCAYNAAIKKAVIITSATSFSTSQRRPFLMKIWNFASYLRRRQLERRGFSITPKGLMKDGVLVDPSVAKIELWSPAKQFYLERIFAAGMLPLFPAAYFYHTPVMDLALTLAIVLHNHWGMMAVASDYARPIVIGEKWAKYAPMSVYVMSVILLAGLLHFNFNDVGLTKAFEMVFSL